MTDVEGVRYASGVKLGAITASDAAGLRADRTLRSALRNDVGTWFLAKHVEIVHG